MSDREGALPARASLEEAKVRRLGIESAAKRGTTRLKDMLGEGYSKGRRPGVYVELESGVMQLWRRHV